MHARSLMLRPASSSCSCTDKRVLSIAGAGMLTLIAPWVNIQFLGSSLTFMMVRTCLFQQSPDVGATDKYEPLAAHCHP